MTQFVVQGCALDSTMHVLLDVLVRNGNPTKVSWNTILIYPFMSKKGLEANGDENKVGNIFNESKLNDKKLLVIYIRKVQL